MALPIGTILDGKLKIVQILGEGGMGTVYKVEQLGTSPGAPPSFYAVKELLISPNTSEDDRKTAIDRFQKEIALLHGLYHPRIAGLERPFQERGNYYFSMEFVSGRSLETILEQARGPLPEEQVIRWMMQVCEALTYIHTRTPPIILRDLKPGNIMITSNNEVKLIDFGIARRFDPSKRTNTENLGTISYASPEHLGSITMPGQRRTPQNPGKLVQTDARSDVYSLGATMYHLLTNFEPDPIQTPAPGSILAKNPHLRTILLQNRVTCRVEEVIIKAMQQKPEQRFQSADAMRTALLYCLPDTQPAGYAAPATFKMPVASPNSTIIVPSMPASNGVGTSYAAGMICPKCGLQNRPGAKFCKRDGQPLVAGVAVPRQVHSQAARIPNRVPPPARQSIQAQPVRSQPIRARPASPSSIQARPAQSTVISARPVQSIQARPVSPPDPMVANRLGLQALVQKNYAEAIRQFKLAHSNGGATFDVLYNLGRAYRQYGQSLRERDRTLFRENMKHAVEFFEEATRLKPDAVDIQFQLGLCFRDLEQPAQAEQVFRRVKTLSPKDPAILYQLGLVVIDQGNVREAERCFQDGLKLNPDHSLMLLALSRLFLEGKPHPARAIEMLRHAVQVDPILWEGWYELGLAHMKGKEWKYALSALERARQVNVHAPQIYSAMAACFLKINKKEEARKMVAEALQRDPQQSEALHLQKQL
ncbi:MAG TPA: protein kinase [Dictyobacter sp.]|jgi:serine/threonine protein kinase/cytochrome c-type biogenesis protein CcmH/NrfG|nr:protein kinase [Dictyobacter sp.]